MPCYLFTYHGYATWLPDHPRGYVHHQLGFQESDPHLASHYRRSAIDEAVLFDRSIQQNLIDAALNTRQYLQIRIHAIASDTTHLHILVSWAHEKSWLSISKSIKGRLTSELNNLRKRRRWFSKGSSRKRVIDRRHFDYLVNTYLPRHNGVCWCEEKTCRSSDASCDA